MRASRERNRGRRRRVAPRARSRAQTTHRRGPRGRGEGSAPRPTAGSRMRVGRVWLVGAGPGDPGLMTVRGLEALRGADVVVYDRLINPTLLDEAPADAIRIYAGKLTESHGLSQEDINVLLIAHARRGRSVVRLKGGDPFVFGRGGEEAEALAASAIPFEVVPGVSAAVAVPAYAGIPLTHRRLASSFAVLTGHEDATRGAPHVDWSRLATAVDTLVILMGARSLPRIAATLVSCGRAPSTPVALIRWGTTEAQETMTCTLGDLPQASLDLRPPLVTVIGDVVSLRDQLRWFDVPPALEAAMATVSFAKTASDSLGERPCSCDRPRRARLVGGRAVQAIGRGTERRGSQWGREGQSEGRRGAGGGRWVRVGTAGGVREP